MPLICSDEARYISGTTHPFHLQPAIALETGNVEEDKNQSIYLYLPTVSRYTAISLRTRPSPSSPTIVPPNLPPVNP